MNMIVPTSVMISICMDGITRAAMAPFGENDVKSNGTTNTAISTNKNV